MPRAAALDVPRTTRRRSPRPTHAVRAALAAVAIGALLPSAQAAGAQSAPATGPTRNRWELLASSGALVPTGALSDAVKRAPLSTAQVSYVVRERLAVTTMVGWARSRDLLSDGDPRVSVFTYDLGAEARSPRRNVGGSATLVVFAGAGAGGRSYNHRDADIAATHGVAAYGAVGGELGAGRVRLRLEARDYVSGFRPLTGGGAADARNDVVVLAGLRFTKRPARPD